MYELLSKYITGEISTEEKQQLLQRLKEDATFRKEAADVVNLSALMAMAGEESEASEFRYRMFVRQRKKRTFWIGVRRASRYAAVVLLSVLSTYLLMNHLVGEGSGEPRYQAFLTPAGQRAKVMLADGTTVWLNANSSLRYPERFDTKSREVELQGEAFFEVQKEGGKPFVVKTSKMDIEVTGTKFNVNAYGTEKNFVVSLVEGAVSVDCANDRGHRFDLRPKQMIIVSDSSSEIKEFENTDFLSWTEGVFIFDDMPMSDIIRKLELYYDVSIVVKNTKLGSYRYTGKFRQRDGVESVLKKLQIVYPFSYTKDDERNMITLQ